MAGNREDFTFTGLANSIDRTRVGKEYAYQGLNFDTDRGVLEGRTGYTKIGERTSAHASDVGYGLGYGKHTGNEIQKLVLTGNPSGGGVRLSFTTTVPTGVTATYTGPSDCNYNATAADVYAHLQTLVDTVPAPDVFAFRPGDVSVTGGPWPGAPIFVEFTGRYSATDVAMLVLATNNLTGGSTPSLTISEFRKGGSNECYYVVVKHNGSTDANLYQVTSSDNFATTTWTSLASNLDASDWMFQQYQDKVFFCNAVDGLFYVYIGSATVLGDRPSPPALGPTYGGPYDDTAWVAIGSGASGYASSGFATSPTVTGQGFQMVVTLNNTESGREVTVTATMTSADDLSVNDIGVLEWYSPTAATLDTDSLKVRLINEDGSPVNIDPVAYSNGKSLINGGRKLVHFAGVLRYSRDNTKKVELKFKIVDAGIGDAFYFSYAMWSNWMNDSLALDIADPDNPKPIKSTIEYGMSYYRASDGVESALSPLTSSPSVPVWMAGNYISVGGYGSTELSASDEQFFYRRCRADGTLRRVPNLWTKNGGYLVTDYGVANDPTGASDSQYDHWMDYELTAFPKYEAIGFPPISTGAQASVIGVWKQSLVVGSRTLAYLSWVGQPFRFEPPPDTPNYFGPDPDIFPDQGVTEFVSDDRSEQVQALIGQDPLYAVTSLSCYSKNGDSPLESSVFRRLPGSRGTPSKRGVYRYGSGVHVGSQDGLWFYKVGRSFGTQDVGTLEEREETGPQPDRGPGVRKSWDRLMSDLWSIAVSGSAGTFTLTFGAQTTSTIAYNASAATVQAALEALSTIEVGDIEVFGADLPGTIYVRLVGQFAQTDAGAITTNGGSGGATATVTEISAGGTGSDLIVFEFNDELWSIHHKCFLKNTRNRRWQEGFLADSVKAVWPNRERGIAWIDTKGRLMKFGYSYKTDNGTAIPWLYETGTLIGSRSRLLKHECHVLGTPNVTVRVEDGAGTASQRTIAMASSRVQTHNTAFRPGMRHRFLFNGVAGTDVIQRFTLISEPAGVKHGT